MRQVPGTYERVADAAGMASATRCAIGLNIGGLASPWVTSVGRSKFSSVARSMVRASGSRDSSSHVGALAMKVSCACGGSWSRAPGPNARSSTNRRAPRAMSRDQAVIGEQNSGRHLTPPFTSRSTSEAPGPPRCPRRERLEVSAWLRSHRRALRLSVGIALYARVCDRRAPSGESPRAGEGIPEETIEFCRAPRPWPSGTLGFSSRTARRSADGRRSQAGNPRSTEAVPLGLGRSRPGVGRRDSRRGP